MKSEAELNAELIKRFKQLSPERKEAFNKFLQEQLEAAEGNGFVISKYPKEMIIPAK